MTFRVVLQPRAEREIRQAARFLLGESRSPAKTLGWVQRLRAKIETLRAHPERCPVDPDSEAYGRDVRVLLFGKRAGVYRVLFTVEGDSDGTDAGGNARASRRPGREKGD